MSESEVKLENNNFGKGIYNKKFPEALSVINPTTIWIRLPPSFAIILPIDSVKVSITDLYRISRVRIPITARQSGSEGRLVVSTFITLILGE